MQKAISEMGFENPTEIQKAVIPQLIENDINLIGLAQTGTGKTAAFGLPLIEKIDFDERSVQGLVLAPTRELCQQIAEQLQQFSKFEKGLNMTAVYGGAAIQQQMRSLKRPNQIIIATPGRLIDLIKRKAVRLDKVKYLVLDEADEMLNMGFQEEIDHILSYTPEEKLTWLFSATMPPEIKKIVRKYMKKPVEVKVNRGKEMNKDIDHQFLIVNNSKKYDVLIRVLEANHDIRGVIFCRTRLDTQRLAEKLVKDGLKADSIHGDLSQSQRTRVMERFKNGSLQLLVATDVAARGIDVNDLSHVIHYTIPEDNSYYTHRSGRTARAGKKGISLALVSNRDKGRLFRMEKQLGIRFSKMALPSREEIMQGHIEAFCNRILDIEYKGFLEKKYETQGIIMLEHLSKQELIAKVLMMEIGKLKK
ncbi:DEAD/DEAH box helicase [Candidatus Kapabacteria bacterium]|nr:DEAD/DEAH box helicase [Candidatus Kapabacteria bacterium]